MTSALSISPISGAKSSSTMPGVRLVNGHTLLPKGLTIATPNPLYVRGQYNVSTNGATTPLPTTNTTKTLPASLVGDSITVLSTSWNDAVASSGIKFSHCRCDNSQCRLSCGHRANDKHRWWQL
jgi:hypothetical protein